MARDYDVAVLGLGIMGSAVAARLAATGRRVIGLDRFTPPHAHGSSHGRGRIIRSAYFESPFYVPLVRRARALWKELEGLSGRPLILPTGALSVGTREGPLIRSTLNAARHAEIAHRFLEPEEVRERYPLIRLRAGEVAVLDEEAGVLLAEPCHEALLERARDRGADLRFAEPVQLWEVEGDRVALTTAEGVYRAARLVLAAGAWTKELAGTDAKLPLRVERQVAYWFEPRTAREACFPERLPVVLWEHGRDRVAYSLPDFGDGLRFGFHHGGTEAHPDHVDRVVGEQEVMRARRFLQSRLPDAEGTLLDASVCLYTNTPDQDFIIDHHPRSESVIVVSACSGHGFKFAVAIAEQVASLLGVPAVAPDLAPFRLLRFR